MKQSPISALSDEAYTEALTVVEIQDCLFNLTKESYIKSLDVIMESVYITTEERVLELSHHIIESVKYRVKSVATYADLLQFLQFKSPENPPLEKIAKFIIDEIFTEITSERVGRCAMQLIQFLSKCFIRQVYTNSEIMDFIRRNLQSKDARQIAILHLFSHFCYLIEELDEPLYNQYLNIIRQISPKDENSPVQLFLSELDGWRENNWFALQTLLSHDYNGITLEGAIISDDDTSLTDCLHQKTFSVNGLMQTNLFTPSNMLETNPTIIQYSAYFGSLKCFKLLLANGADLTVETYENCSTIKFAAAGGNMGIIKILDDKKFNFRGASHYAAIYHHYDLLVWAIENKDKRHYTNCTGLGTPFECCATSNFIKGILYFMQNAIDINICWSGANPLFYACVFGQLDAVKLLLSHKDIQPDIKDSQGILLIIFI